MDSRSSKRPNPVSQYCYDDYTVAIVCAFDFELSAVRWMLDAEHQGLPGKDGDSNSYILGELSGHNVVITWLPGTQGKVAAAHVAVHLERSFPKIKWRLLIGQGGGVPSAKNDIRLGDVVVSMPDGGGGQSPGVFQYDLGKQTENSFEPKGSLCDDVKRDIWDFLLKEDGLAEILGESQCRLH